jgi:hypothetical protein
MRKTARDTVRSTSGLAGWALVVLLVLLSACSPPTSFAIDDFRIPADATYGQACFQEAEASGVQPGQIESAIYRADATYRRGFSFGPDRIDIRFFARSTPPGDVCIDANDPGNVAISDTITLEVQTPTRIEVGGTELAAVLETGTYWLGATVQNASFGFGDSVSFTNGRLFVVY